MLEMGITIPILGCFTFLVAITINPALCTIYDEKIEEDAVTIDPDLVGPKNNSNREKRCTTDPGFLIGEETPVWLAYRPDPAKPVNYTMLERGIVKQAIADWRKVEPFGLTNIKKEGDGQEFVGPLAHPPVARYVEPGSKPTWCYDYRHIHVLVAMDYPSSWPTNEKDQQKYIKEKIVYAVAFWNSIHHRLWNLEIPKYQIRIAGIIIGRNKEATPYLRAHEKDGRLLQMHAAAQEMNIYWENIAKTESDFPLDGRHLLATMTELQRPYGMNGWATESHDGHHGMIYTDDLAVNSMDELTSKTLLPSLRVWCEAKLKDYPHLSEVGTHLSSDLPMPGQLISPNKQCEARGYTADNFVCYYKSFPCNKLACRRNWFFGRCTTELPALDGTFCREGMQCLSRFCVQKNTVSYARHYGVKPRRRY